MALAPRSLSLYVDGAQNRTHFDRGIPRYVLEHLRALHGTVPEAIESVLLNPRLPLSGNLSWLLGTGLLRWAGGDRRFVRRTSAERPAIYHVMSVFEPESPLEIMWPAWARDARVATVVTLYDLIPLLFDDHYLRLPRARVEYQARLNMIRHADQVQAISQTTANDAVEQLGVPEERVHVIDAGATETFAEMYDSEEAAWRHIEHGRRPIRPGFVLYVGGFEFRKNLDGLIAGYGRLPADVRAAHQLVIVCRLRPEEEQLLRRRVAEVGLHDGEVVLTGYLSDEELGALYRTCTLFVFPSLYEGSGLPILEAMSCGAAVAASATSTGPELLGDPEGTFDPRDPGAIADCIGRLLGSPETLERLRDRSRHRVDDYTWSRVAAKSIAGYERIGATRPRRRSHRPRIALVTPWWPDESGIADYNARLAGALRHRVDVDVVVGGSVDGYALPADADGIRLLDHRRLAGANAISQHDRIVYCMGNSRFHGYIYELLRRRPGAVVLHDVRLTGFYGWYSGQERPEDPAGRLAERITALYGPRLGPDATRAGAPGWQQQLALGIYMTGEVQSYAEQCFVHSRFARDVLELDRNPLDRSVGTAVLPFAMPPPAGEPRSGDAPAAPLVISLGYVSEVKGVAELIRAFGLFARDHPGARLVLAGPLESSESERWHAYAREHAPGAAIELPGRVGDDRYRQLLADADVAVQLRTISNGEASAAVADCLAAGVPTVVTDLGWLGELPGTVVEKVALGVSPDRLRAAIEGLLTAPRREQVSRAALAHAGGCGFDAVAEAYLEALDLR